MNKPSVLCLMGPTACGKTALALLLARELGCEIISVDSVQVYRGMDIGSAKPSAEVLAEYPHHLINIREVSQSYSAADFQQEASALITQIIGCGKIPLLVGGTFLYFRALEGGLDPLPASNEAVRLQVSQQAASVGWQVMHKRLGEFDPVAAERIDANDVQRIQRAFEVFELTGMPMSHFFSAKKKNNVPFNFIKLALLPSDRSWLYARINQRFNEMIALGFVDEVRALFYINEAYAECTASRAVGYRQLLDYLQGHLSLNEAVEKAKTASRRYAKRQLTWLRKEDNIRHFMSENPQIAPNILQYIKRKLDV